MCPAAGVMFPARSPLPVKGRVHAAGPRNRVIRGRQEKDTTLVPSNFTTAKTCNYCCPVPGVTPATRHITFPTPVCLLFVRPLLFFFYSCPDS